MYTQVKKSKKEHKSRAVAKSVDQRKNGTRQGFVVINDRPQTNRSRNDSTFQFVDNRPEAIAQRKLQRRVNNSPQVKQLKALRKMVNNHSAVVTLRKENLKEEEPLRGKFEPIQMKAGIKYVINTLCKHPYAAPNSPRFRMNTRAILKTGGEYNENDVAFRQSVGDSYEIKEGPNKGVKDGRNYQDDGYTEEHDEKGIPGELHFQDNPGWTPSMGIKPDDDLDYTYTFGQYFYDKSDGNKLILQIGPHSGTIKGTGDREYTPKLGLFIKKGNVE